MKNHYVPLSYVHFVLISAWMIILDDRIRYLLGGGTRGGSTGGKGGGGKW